MHKFPKLLVSSVVRGASQGDSHGGLYLVDLDSETFDQVIDWDTVDINFDGRGADRGLRGIAIHEDRIYVAASDELFVFDQQLNIVRSYKNAYLKHCHEICAHRGSLFLTSTGFDSILRFNLASGEFDYGFHLTGSADEMGALTFDPRAADGPKPVVSFHINSVYVDDFGMFVSGLQLPALIRFTPKNMSTVAALPSGTHNARPFQGGVLLNDTEEDRVAWLSEEKLHLMPVPRYDRGDLVNADIDGSGLARQAFARGLCPLTDRIVAGGSSPTTVSVYDVVAEEKLKSINLTMDVRNAAHGMTIWPY